MTPSITTAGEARGRRLSNHRRIKLNSQLRIPMREKILSLLKTIEERHPRKGLDFSRKVLVRLFPEGLKTSGDFIHACVTRYSWIPDCGDNDMS